MADVQTENGFTKIANEILEQAAKGKFNGTQWSIMSTIWRYTYGFQRKEHFLSLTFLSEATTYDKRSIQRELKKLKERRVIYQVVKKGSSRVIGFNKNYDEWILESSSSTIGEITNGEITDEEFTNVTIGEITNRGIGENPKGTIGEFANQERKNKKNIKEKYKETTTGSESVKLNPFLEYEKAFGFPSAIVRQDFDYWIDQGNFRDPEEIIVEAIHIAHLENVSSPGNYIAKVLSNWHDRRLFTLEQVKEFNDRRFNKQRGQRPNKVEPNDIYKKDGYFSKSITEGWTQEDFDKFNQEVMDDPDLL